MIINPFDKEYAEAFEKKFKGFCERAPIYISYSIIYDEVYIKDIINDRTFTFSLDEKRSIHDTITIIKNKLKEKSYPRLIEEKIVNVDPPVSELLEATKNDIPFDKAFASLSKKVHKTEYLIDKVNLKKNQIIIENIETKEQFLYQLTIPVVLFLKKKIRTEKNPAAAFISLQQEGELLYKIERKK